MAPSPTIRRLLKETKELSQASNNPNPAFYSAPVSDSDLHEWHFTLLGPPAPSPYAGGLYHGRITLPAAYPMKPPNFRFLTASGRFEVNREICLSISGFHEETWQPAWGIRTALTALRSFMAEPGTAGQVGGLESSEDVRKTLATASRKWRCATCGQQTNEERMKDWWRICAERGIKVEEEHMAIEALPEGLAVEARDVNQQPSQQQQKPDEQAVVSKPTMNVEEDATPAPSITAQTAATQPHTLATSRDTPTEIRSRLQAQAQTSSILQQQQQQPLPSTAEATTTSSNRSAITPTMSSHRPPGGGSVQVQSTPTTATTTTTTNSYRRATEQPTITIDRAITAVFLALCVMILKKIFYPAATGPHSYDELNLLRE